MCPFPYPLSRRASTPSLTSRRFRRKHIWHSLHVLLRLPVALQIYAARSSENLHSPGELDDSVPRGSRYCDETMEIEY